MSEREKWNASGVVVIQRRVFFLYRKDLVTPKREELALELFYECKIFGWEMIYNCYIDWNKSKEC